ncbi:hypothetical protein [Dyadobacter sp. CY323]|uniref:hypothetical protein n=1 Tax=Dyadobacter sp. CY323 TaxID=2907302 RepID=UPI001F40F9DB|nr:hypothetical protein [Dyadobacter sp. CY323]MCE6987623.1 hypothetical protein [Dyadobacter sp. CY323]
MLKTLYILVIAGFCLQQASAQSVSRTSGAVCKYCLPIGWSMDGSASNLFPSISNSNHWGGESDAPWVPALQGTPPSGYNTFLSSYNSVNVTNTSSTTITGLTPGQTFYLKYSVMASRTEYSGGKEYGETATLQLSAGATESETTTFVPNENTSKWITKYLKFTPTATSAKLTFSGTGSSGGFVNLDIDDAAISRCPDLSPNMVIEGLNFGPEKDRDFLVNIYEINNGKTNQSISFRITKINGFTITYSNHHGISKVFGDKQNENGNWTFTETAQFITATSNAPIAANGKATIGFNVKRKAVAGAGLTQNLTTTVLSNSGGEIKSQNNTALTSLSTN